MFCSNKKRNTYCDNRKEKKSWSSTILLCFRLLEVVINGSFTWKTVLWMLKAKITSFTGQQGKQNGKQAKKMDRKIWKLNAIYYKSNNSIFALCVIQVFDHVVLVVKYPLTFSTKSKARLALERFGSFQRYWFKCLIISYLTSFSGKCVYYINVKSTS